MTREKNHWVPEICYEEMDSGVTSNIPFINVPANQKMPGVLFIFESKETGEIEPGEDGSDLPVYEMNLHQYADMETLKTNLTPLEYDRVREALGLEPLQVATEKGKKITDTIRSRVT